MTIRRELIQAAQKPAVQIGFKPGGGGLAEHSAAAVVDAVLDKLIERIHESYENWTPGAVKALRDIRDGMR